eukprot:NODE_27506_length_511_cov_1.966146.p5 GENE.NODE_27506_length_511_cov_1.966146~~NODE_27506_length_511_cov_1.966146.p5  ORF type:complete len:57 (-),score=5.22 NODE_27506_length_511_cov_1.966146:115-285(-)
MNAGTYTESVERMGRQRIYAQGARFREVLAQSGSSAILHRRGAVEGKEAESRRGLR